VPAASDPAVAGLPETPHGLKRFLPIFAWLPQYRPEWLPRDVIAGLTTWALVVPEAMAYAGIAGVPVQYGLYAVPLALAGYAVFGSCRELFVGPSAGIATLSAAAVGAVVVASKDPSLYIALTGVLSLTVGAIFVVGGLARMGFIANFFAKPVLEGFIIGLGIFMIVGQIPKVVGIEKPSGDTVAVLVNTLADIGSWDWTTVAVGVSGLVALFAMARLTPKLPAAIVVVVASILAVNALDLGDHGVALVGHVPTGFDFVPYSGITADDVVNLLPGALAIVVVGFAQSIAIAKAFAAERHEGVDANQEMIGYGAANLGAGALQGFPVAGSLSKSAAAKQAGAISPLAPVVAGLMVVATIFFLAGLFKNLPEAILGAIVIQAVSGMVDFSKLAVLWRAHTVEFWAAIGALLGVVVINILPGVVIGVALSFILLIHSLGHPHIGRLGRSRDGLQLGDMATHPDFAPVPGVLIDRFEAPLIFANAGLFTDDLRRRVREADPLPETVVLDFEAVGDVDVTGADALRAVHETLSGLGIGLVIARANSSVRLALRRYDVLDAIGAENFKPTVHEAVEANPTHNG
jgi:SulP family sulfate permease